MAFELEFKYGENVTMVDHTPGADVAAGEVIVFPGGVGIAHRKILANQLGALGWHDGVYKGIAVAAYAKGTTVYWDTALNKVTTTAAGNEHLGTVVQASTGADGEIWVHHTQAAPPGV